MASIRLPTCPHLLFLFQEQTATHGEWSVESLPGMSLADALRKKQGELRRAETIETTKEGQKYRVIRNDQGEEISRELIAGVVAPLIESAPDPAVVHIIDGLYLGSQDAAVNLVNLVS